jgi:hypothetical protein
LSKIHHAAFDAHLIGIDLEKRRYLARSCDISPKNSSFGGIGTGLAAHFG